MHRCVLWKMEKYIRQWILAGEECIGNAVRDRYGEQVWERLKQGERGEYTVDILFSVSINERYGSLQLQLIDCQ